tara:strand:- start:7 stop:129 length:123 start_codon:yes stop_codon:yes gene_type:complete
MVGRLVLAQEIGVRLPVWQQFLIKKPLNRGALGAQDQSQQ